MKADDINKVIDKLATKLGIGSEKLIEVYKGEASVFIVAYWIYFVIAILTMIIGGTMIYYSLDMTTITESSIYGRQIEMTTGGGTLFVSGIIVAFIGLITFIAQIVNIEKYLECKKVPETYAVTRIMNTIFKTKE